MGLETKYTLVCNRCGVEVAVNPKWGGGLADAVDEASRSGRKWRKVDDKRVLCPDCTPAYDEMVSKHEAEFAEFFHEL